MSAVNHVPQGRNRGDDQYALLIDRIRKAPLDDSGKIFVARALSEPGLRETSDGSVLLDIALTAQQHGLVDEAVDFLHEATTRFPDDQDAWYRYLELLDLLGRRDEFIRQIARAEPHVGKNKLRSWFKGRTGDNAIEDGPEWCTEPFRELRREEEEIRLFMRFFRGRPDDFARQWVNREEGKSGYVPVRRPLTADDIRDHLSGRRTYGIYLLNSDAMVHTGVIDMDLVPALRDIRSQRKNKNTIRREALYLHKRISAMAAKSGLCCLAEVSGGKGYHFWFPVAEPVPAAAMRQVLQTMTREIERDVTAYSLEVFPKQDRVTGKGYGNLVKLPLGIHRKTGKPSFFILAADRERKSQFDLLATLTPSPAARILNLVRDKHRADVLVHPRQKKRQKEYPELAALEQNCPMLGQVMATLTSSRTLSLREEKVLLGTLSHVKRGRLLLHHLFSHLPDYNRPLLDYRISRVRGGVLGCRRIHSLLEAGPDLPCTFSRTGDYPHPLLHLTEEAHEPAPRQERVDNLKDALVCLKTAIRQVERFME